MTPAASTTSSPRFVEALRRLYLTRFAFAVLWAGALLLTSDSTGPLLTTLLTVYPLFDAGAVLWRLRADPHAQRPKAAERINIVVSLLFALGLAVASTASIAASLAVWGVWAIGSGVPQLITAIRSRQSGGQVAQMLSGGISVLAGGAFLAQGLRDADDIAGVAGYAVLGGLFFLVSSLRLGVVVRRIVG